MRIAVTGGSGFVGFHLVKELSDSGHDVIILDKNPPPTSNFNFYQVDLTDLDSLKKGLEKVDVVYHLGAIADASLAYKDYKMTFDVNVLGTYNVLEASRLNNVQKVVYASTIWVYNASTITNVDETSQFTTNTEHVYTTTKFFGEYLCQDFHNMYDLNFTILRFGIPYGPGSLFNVIPIFIKKALNNESLTIRGSGEQKRQFVFVKDLVKGCKSALLNEADNEIFNLVGIKMVSVKEVAETISSIIPGTKIEYIPDREGELGYRMVSSEKTKEKLGWEATTSFEDGVNQTIEWYKLNI